MRSRPSAVLVLRSETPFSSVAVAVGPALTRVKPSAWNMNTNPPTTYKLWLFDKVRKEASHVVVINDRNQVPRACRCETAAIIQLPEPPLLTLIQRARV